MRDEDYQKMVNLVACLLIRAGGEIVFSQEEIHAAKGKVVFEEKPDKAGFQRLHLIPDYVAIGPTEAEERERELKERADKQLADMLQTLRDKSSGTQQWAYGSSTTYQPSTGTQVTSNGVQIGTVSGTYGNTFEMKLTDKGRAFAQRIAATTKNMYSIGRDPAGRIKEISLMADTPKAPKAPEPTPPPEGGGMNTIDPSFANQGGSAPKESKPAKSSDVTRKR